MQLLQVNRSAQLVLCPQPNLCLLTPHFPRDLGACLVLLAFCRVKSQPFPQGRRHLAAPTRCSGKDKANRSHSMLAKRDRGCAIRRTQFWLKVFLGSPRSACQEYISPETAIPSSLSLVVRQAGLRPVGGLPSAPNGQKLI